MPLLKRNPAVLFALLGLAACAPAAVGPVPGAPAPAEGLPPIPTAEGPLAIRVVYPTPATPRPRVDSTFVFGSVGSGRASLVINGTPVTVAPNGAFLAYLPVPADGTYRLVAEGAGQRTEAAAAYRAPPAPAPAGAAPTPPVRTEIFPAPVMVRVSGGADTLATGSDVAAGAPTLTADRVWQLPRGARLVATARRANQTRVSLAGTEAWFADSLLTSETAPSEPRTAAGAVRLRPAAEYVDVQLPVSFAPFRVHAGRDTVGITVYGRIPAAGAVPVAGERLFTGAAWRPAAGDSARLDLALARPLWGFKAFYEADGTLVLRVRRPPRVDAGRPLEGVRVLVDPGHPPLGAVGPTGLTEADANLAIGLRLAERLRERGAEVVMTRVDDTPLVSRTDVAAELAARTALAVRSDAHLLVSVHNNAFPEGINPFVSAGTETYYFYPFAAELAQALNREIVDATRIRNLGAKRRSLALARPTWMPSTLTESLFMMIPEQEAALRNPAFLDRLADAHLRGIEAFVRERGESVR